MSIRIIEADASHAAAIAAIGKKSFREAFGSLFRSREELVGYLEHTYNPVKLANSLRKGNNVYFLAWKDHRPAGFAKIKINSLNEHIETVAQMELQKLYVLPELQRQGVGAALLNEVKRLALDIQPDYLWLDTCVDNHQGIRFYERHGFEKIGKYFFTIGTQVFEYHVMGMAVALEIKTAC